MQFNLALALLLASGSLAVLAAPMPQQQDDRNGLVANVDKTVNDPLTMVNDIALKNGGTPQISNVPGLSMVVGDTGAVAPTGSDKGKSRRQLPLDALGGVTNALGGLNPLGQSQRQAGSDGASPSPQLSSRQLGSSGSDAAPSGPLAGSPLSGTPLSGTPLSNLGL